MATAYQGSVVYEEGATLVHKDPEFESVSGLKTVALPYKPRRSRS